MASENFLAGLAGLVSGVEQGLQDREQKQSLEAERAFRLQQFESEQRRNAVLDALNERVAEGQLAIQERASKLAEAKFEQEEANLEEIPVTVGGQTFNLTRESARQLQAISAQQALVSQNLIPLELGGQTYRVTPEFAAGLTKEGMTEADRRKFNIKELVARRADAILSSSPGTSIQEAQRQAIIFGAMLFPDEFAGFDLSAFEPPAELQPTAGPSVPSRGADIATYLGVASLGGPALAGVAAGLLGPVGQGDPIEVIRQLMFGNKPPQTIEELQAQREAVRLQTQGSNNRTRLQLGNLGGGGDGVQLPQFIQGG